MLLKCVVHGITCFALIAFIQKLTTNWSLTYFYKVLIENAEEMRLLLRKELWMIQ